LHDIRNGRYAEPIAQLRSLYQANKPAYDRRKRTLPGFTMSGTCSDRKTPLVHSGLVQVDIDDIADRLPDLRRQIESDPHVAFGFVSPSGVGLKLGVAIDGDHHQEGFIAAHGHFGSRYKIEIDPSVKDPLRLCFVSHDPELWIQKEPQALQSSTESSDVIVCGGDDVSYSVKELASYSVKSIEQAVELSLPTQPRRNNRSLFLLARALISLERITPVSTADRLRAFSMWYERTGNLGFIRHTREQYQLEFMNAIRSAEHPLGESPIDEAWKKVQTEPLPLEAAIFDEETPRKIMALCVHLDRATASPWYLSCRTAGKLLGLSHTACSVWLGGFVRMGLLNVMEPGTKQRATRYRCAARTT